MDKPLKQEVALNTDCKLELLTYHFILFFSLCRILQIYVLCDVLEECPNLDQKEVCRG